MFILFSNMTIQADALADETMPERRHLAENINTLQHLLLLQLNINKSYATDRKMYEMTDTLYVCIP